LFPNLHPKLNCVHGPTDTILRSTGRAYDGEHALVRSLIKSTKRRYKLGQY